MTPQIFLAITNILTVATAAISLGFLVFILLKKRRTGRAMIIFALVASLCIFLFGIFGWHFIHQDDICSVVYGGCPSAEPCPVLYSARAACLHPIDIVMLIFAIVIFAMLTVGIISNMDLKSKSAKSK